MNFKNLRGVITLIICTLLFIFTPLLAQETYASRALTALPLRTDLEARDYIASTLTMLSVNIGQYQDGIPVYLAGVSSQIPTITPKTASEWISFGNDVILGLIKKATETNVYKPGLKVFATAFLARVDLVYVGQVSLGFAVDRQTLPVTATNKDIKWQYAYAGIAIIFRGIQTATPIDVPQGYRVIAVPEEETVNFDPRLIGRAFSVLLTFTDGSSVVCTNTLPPTPPIVTTITRSANGLTFTITGGAIGRSAELLSAPTPRGPWSPFANITLTDTNTLSYSGPLSNAGFYTVRQ